MSEQDLDNLFPPAGEDTLRRKIDELACQLSASTEKTKKLESRFELLKQLYFELLFTSKA